MRLPSGQIGIDPAWSGQEYAPLRAQVVTRSGEPVLLRSDAKVRVYLGALTDGEGLVHEWLELCAADPGGEARLGSQAEGLTRAEPGSVLHAPGPIDPEQPELPGSRYHERLAATGPVLVRRRPAATLAECADVLSGSQEGAAHLSTPREVRSELPDGGERTASGFLMAHEGTWGRLLETLHLKLSLILGCCERVTSVSRALGLPILGLSDSSFGVFRPQVADGMPAWWAWRVSLLDAGAAEPIDGLQGGFLSGRSNRSVYRGDDADTVAGTCEVRARSLDEKPDGGFVLKGTLKTDEAIRANSLVRVFVPSHADRVELLLKTGTDEALSAGEVRFEADVPGGTDVEKFRSATVGIPIRSLSFETIPNAGIGADLYALGVLGLRVLFGGEDQRLAETIDDLWSLARAANEAEDRGSIAEAMAALADETPRWKTGLGPHRLLRPSGSPEEAFDAIPPSLWWPVVATVARLFPGLTSESFVADIIGKKANLHEAPAAAAGAFGDLCVRTRSLIAVDWRYTREVHGLIRERITAAASAD